MKSLTWPVVSLRSVSARTEHIVDFDPGEPESWLRFYEIPRGVFGPRTATLDPDTGSCTSSEATTRRNYTELW